VAGNTATDVRLGQFVVDRNAFGGTWSLTIGYNNGVSGSAAQFADSTFALPAPGAIALLGIAGLTVGRRRRSG
jgi:MYXO-CTERM domain-containing protein